MAREASFGFVSISGGTVSFAENIQIKESGRSRTADYHIVGKQYTMFAQLGAHSRQFMLSFNLTHRSNVLGLLAAIRNSTFAQNGLVLPTISVNYGGAFSGIRGICKNYNIQIDEMAGYRGNIPNRVRVTMTIAETSAPSVGGGGGGFSGPTTPG